MVIEPSGLHTIPGPSTPGPIHLPGGHVRLLQRAKHKPGSRLVLRDFGRAHGYLRRCAAELRQAGWLHPAKPTTIVWLVDVDTAVAKAGPRPGAVPDLIRDLYQLTEAAKPAAVSQEDAEAVLVVDVVGRGKYTAYAFRKTLRALKEAEAVAPWDGLCLTAAGVEALDRVSATT